MLSANEERSGLWMIASSLAVIVVVCALFLTSHRTARLDQNRAQGSSLVGALADVPFDRLVPPAGQAGPLQLLKSSVSNPDFAYAVVTDPEGRVLTRVSPMNLEAPPAVLAPQPASWLGDRELELADGRAVQEFHAPILETGVLMGHIRIGYLEPTAFLLGGQINLLGILALPIFLLTLLALRCIRQEIEPVERVSRQLDDAVTSERITSLMVEATGGTGEFVDRFNRFVQFADQRLGEFEESQKELRTASKILSYQKERSESVLDALPDAALVLDDAGKVTFANDRLQTLLHIDPAHAVRAAPAEWCPYEELTAFLVRFASGNAPRHTKEVRFSPSTEPDRHYAIQAHRLGAGRAASAAGTIVLIRDVSTTALAERAHSEFISHVTHELKTPLNSIAMYSESLLEKPGESEEFRIEACNVIQDEVHRLSELLKALHTMARIETGTIAFDRQRIALADFIRDASESIARSGRRMKVSVELDLPGDLPAIRGDKDLLRVALNNLLTNAVKYSHEGGRVQVSVEEQGEYISVRVADQGIGVSEEELSHIFEKFFRSESTDARKRSGHGLGLSLAREIAELQGGRIEVQSVEGEGSTFSLVIPKNTDANEGN